MLDQKDFESLDNEEEEDWWCFECDNYRCQHGLCRHCEGCEECDPDDYESEENDNG